MSGLNPGGSRKKEGRIFSPKTIAKQCQRAKGNRDHAAIAETSPATRATGNREAERRRRQLERKSK